MLDGYKTYIAAALLIVAGVLMKLGYLDGDTGLAVMAVLGGGGLAALRRAKK